MARLPPTPEDLARGARLKALRQRLNLTQSQVFPGSSNHTQVLNAEKGKNKLNGRLLRVLAKAYGLTIEQLEAYGSGAMSIEQALQARETGEAAGKGRGRLDPSIVLDVVGVLHSLDGVPMDAALRAAGGIALEAPDGLRAYVAARMALRLEADLGLTGESILDGPDVASLTPATASLLATRSARNRR